jgi:MFS family permease
MSRTLSQEEKQDRGQEKGLRLTEDDPLTTVAASGGAISNNPIVAPSTADTPPDGGREAWLCVVGGVCSWFVTFGWVYSVGIFQEYYSQGPLRNYSPSEVAWISSTEIFFTFSCGPIVGKLFDNYGPRGILLVGSFLHIFGVMMVSLGDQYYQFFLAQSVCSAVGVSALFFASVDTALTWFRKKAATAMGIMTAGSSIGGVVLPIMITKLVPRIGFPWTIRVVGFIFLALLIVVNLTVKSHLVHRPTSINPMEFVRPLRDMTFATLCLAGAFVVLGSLLPSNFIILQAQRNGVSHSLSSYLLPVVNAAR